MDTVLTVKWRLIVARGLIAVAFGLAMAIWPDLTLLTAIVLFGVFALSDGFATVFVSFTRRSEDRWLPLAIGWAAMLIGALALAWPVNSTGLLMWTAIAWALVTGIGYVVLGYRSQGDARSMLLFTAVGLIAVVLAIVLSIRPDAGSEAMATTFGIFVVVLGALSAVLGIQLRRIAGDLRKGKVSDPESMP